jgi:hypothetical protein
MKTTTAPKKVTVNRDQKLYVIPTNGGYTCLGFQVCIDRITRLAKELGQPAKLKTIGTLHNYRELKRLQATAAQQALNGYRFKCELSPQLIGLEGKRVEVVTLYGETRRFIVGKSTGWLPIHLETARKDSHGGGGAHREYKSVRTA